MKATRAQTNYQGRELRQLMAVQYAKEVHHRTVPNRRGLADQDRSERSDPRADLTRRENHFDFFKMHYLTPFASHIWPFGSILMHPTEIGELAHKDRIQDGYRRSIKNQAARHILSHYGRRHTVEIRLQTREALLKVQGLIVVEDSRMEMPTVPSRRTPCRALKGRIKNTSTLTKLCTALDLHYSNMMEEIVCFIRQTAADDRRLAADPAELGLLPVEGFPQLEIPVPDFQETDRFQIPRARCTGRKAFRNSGFRNDWVWVQTGGEVNYGDFRGRVVARLVAPFKIRNILSQAAAVLRQAFLCILDPITGSRFHIPSRHIQVRDPINSPDMRIVSIGALIGPAHVIPTGEKQWILNLRIDLRTFNEIY